MKKGIIVLLIAVLAIGSAFAGTLKGNATLNFGVDFDAKKWGFANATETEYKFKFELDSTKVEVGEHKTDVWAEIAAEGSATVSEKNEKHTATFTAPSTVTVAGENFKMEVKITKANVHVGEDLTFGILNAGSSKTFVAHYEIDATTKKPIINKIENVDSPVPGFTVKYKDWNGGFGASGDYGSETYNIFAHVETPAFKLEDLAVEGSAYANLTEAANTSKFGGAAKASYKADALSAFVALDANYAAEKFNYEAAARAKFTFDADANGFGQVDVYATPGALAVPASYTGDNAKAVKLDAKLSGGYDFALAEKQTLKTTAYVEVKDAIIDGRKFTVGATETFTVDKIEFYLSEDYHITDKILNLEAKATYKADLYKAWAGLKADFQFADNSKDALTSLKPELGIESSKVIENAVASLTWKDVDLVKNAAGDITNLGKVTASLKIAF